MKYIAHDAVEDGCIFCNRLASDDDTQSLILRRAELAFVIMNLFPYNTGHVMIVPNRHVADPEELSSDEILAFGSLLPEALRALRRVLSPSGFNIGMNVGAVAGAGVADHLHQHVVPRWQGDANFMPIIAGAMVVPELVPATYAKVRAEFAREASRFELVSAALVVLSVDASKVLLEQEGRLPTVTAIPNEAIHRSASNYLRTLGIAPDLVGWAGNASTKERSRIAFAYLESTHIGDAEAARWVPVNEALDCLASDEDRETLRRALALDLTIVSAPPG
jgi:ATP adenylyltransferase